MLIDLSHLVYVVKGLYGYHRPKMVHFSFTEAPLRSIVSQANITKGLLQEIYCRDLVILGLCLISQSRGRQDEIDLLPFLFMASIL